MGHEQSDSVERLGDGPSVATKPGQRPKRKPPEPLPPYKVLLHNDDVNEFEYVVITVAKLTPLGVKEAFQRTLEAHHAGLSLLLTTHKERAELYQQQFASTGLTVTVEPG